MFEQVFGNVDVVQFISVIAIALFGIATLAMVCFILFFVFNMISHNVEVEIIIPIRGGVKRKKERGKLKIDRSTTRSLFYLFRRNQAISNISENQFVDNKITLLQVTDTEYVPVLLNLQGIAMLKPLLTIDKEWIVQSLIRELEQKYNRNQMMIYLPFFAFLICSIMVIAMVWWLIKNIADLKEFGKYMVEAITLAKNLCTQTAPAAGAPPV